MRTMDAALRAGGVHVDIATTDDNGPGRHLERQLAQPLHEDEDRAHGAHWYFRKNTDFYKCSWSFARWIARHARDYDLVHIHALFSFTSVVAARASYRAGVPYIVRPLGTLSPYGLRERRARLKRWSLRWVEGPLLERAAAVHVTSEQERKDVEGLGLRVDCRVIPLGLATVPDAGHEVSLPNLFPQFSGKRLLLFLSRLDPKKNAEALIDAFSLIASDFPDCELVIAGAGEPAYAIQLREYSGRASAPHRIHWLGHVQGEAKASLLAGACLFVLPSYSENFGIAAAEALAAGLPCVLAEGVALASRVVAEQAGLMTGTNGQSIAAAIRKILSDDALRSSMSARARRLAALEYADATMATRLLALYNEKIKLTAGSGEVA